MGSSLSFSQQVGVLMNTDPANPHILSTFFCLLVETLSNEESVSLSSLWEPDRLYFNRDLKGKDLSLDLRNPRCYDDMARQKLRISVAGEEK